MLFGVKGIAQEIVIPKDTIYMEYKPNDGSLPHFRGKKFKNKHGINFNLYEGDGLFFPNDGELDTLEISKVKDYHITEVDEIDSLGRLWYRKNLKILQKKWGKIFPPHDMNGKFVTYLIEKEDDYFIKYRVYWRNQKP